jgi:hypothetical protein
VPAGASIRKAAQLLPLAAVHPELVISRLTLGQAKSIALLLRWREAAMARSICHLKGEVGPLLRGALERAGAMPIRPPLTPQQQKKAKQRRSSLQEQPGQTGQSNKGAQQQQGEDDAAAWAGLSDEDDDEAAAAGGLAGQSRKQRRKLARRGKVLRDTADMSCSGSESDSESGGKASSSEEEEGEGGGRLQRGKQQQQGRGGSARAAAAAAKQKGRVADLLAMKQAGTAQEKRRAVQQHLQHIGVKDEAAAAGGASDTEDSDDEGIGASGGVSHSRAAAAAAAAKASQGEKIDVLWRDYKARVPASESAFSADLQRWAGERNVEIKLGKVGCCFRRLAASLNGCAASCSEDDTCMQSIDQPVLIIFEGG